RRAVRVRVAHEARWIAAEDAGRYRQALGVALPVGLPDAFLEDVDEPLASLLVRWARTHVPFFSADPAGRWRLPLREVEQALRRLAGRMREYRPQLLDQLISAGEVVWTGRGSLGSSDGRIALYLRSDAARLIREPDERPSGEIHGRLREQLQNRGASFFRDLYYAT